MSKVGKATKIARTGLMLGASLTALIATSPAFAQATSDTATEETVPPESSPAEADAQLEAQSVADTTAEAPAQDDAIVVTGSRIRRTEATSASPLQIIDPTLGFRQGQSTAAELIQSSPIAAGSSQISAAISSNFVTNGGPGSQTISLRGLGAERTLVLLNSKRAGPAGTRGGVTAFDLNVLPAGIIRSVEILKDGASSIYGSDAIAGVVNILTKRDTDGLEISANASVPQKAGGNQYDVGLTWGKEFDRGHFLVSANYYKQRMLRRRDREYLGCPEDYIFRSDGTTRADLIDPRTNRPACIQGVTWGHVWTYYAYNLPDMGQAVLLQPDYGQNLGQYPGTFPVTWTGGGAPGELVLPPGYWPVSLTGDGPSTALLNSYNVFEQKASVIPETTRKTLYADGSFDVTDNVQLYGEFLYNNRKTFTDSLSQMYNFGGVNFEPTPGEPFPGFYQPGGPGDQFVFPGTDENDLPCENCTNRYVYLSPTGIFDKYDNTIEVDYYRAVAGVKGEIANNWRWDVYGQYSRSIGKYTYNQIIEDALYTQWYKYGSCEGDVTPISGLQCIDINWVDPNFLAGLYTPEQEAFLIGEETGKTKYVQKYIEGTIAGNLFDLPAGPLGVAIGGVYRRDTINDRPGDITMAPNPDFDPNLSPGDPECSDSSDPCSEFVDNAYANPVSSGHTRGYAETTEAFGEVNIPVFRDSFLGRSFDLAAAARITNVKAVRRPDGLTDKDTGNWTYKLQGNWQVTNWLRLRSTYGTSFRAPALFEQFLAGQVTGARQVNVDPCVNWADGLADGTITPRIAQNCAASQAFAGGPPGGIEDDHTGAGIQVKVFNSGGIGQLDPETSRSFTASMILTPRFSFLPDTSFAFTVDYFDIKVKGEITQLGAANILRGCYDAEDFPGNPLCTLFQRGQVGDPENLISVQDSFININRQRNRGLDFTLRADHRFGADTRLSILANATRQLQDDITLFGGELDNLNGEIADPKFTADLNLTLDKGPWSFFWGSDYVGKTSNEKEFIEDNGGLCNTNPNNVLLYGDYCYRVRTKAKLYHSASITRRVADDRFQITMGIANLFDTKPPRISPGGVAFTIGQISGLASQYDLFGRRFFLNVKAKIK